MATPDFVPQDSTNFTDIRYYTALDPYYYTVDNRPIQDIETNLQDIREGGGDAARRATVLTALAAGSVNASLFNTQTATRGMSGLGVVQVNATTARILAGSVYESRTVSTSITNAAVKQALLTAAQDFTITPPVSGGTSIVYTVEGQFVDLTQANMGASTLPYLDATNAYLPSTLMVGELKLSLVAGVAATTGTEVPAATTAGKFPIYNITVANGAVTFTVSMHASGPYLKGIHKTVAPVPLTSGGATVAQTNEMTMYTFVDGSTTGVILPISLAEADINPFNPIKLKITFTPTVTSNAAAFRLRYKAFSTGELITVPGTTTSIDAVTVTALANGVQTFTTTLAKIPNTEFADFVSGSWALNKEYLNIILERVGADASDTNTGSIRIMSVALVQ